MDEGAIAYKGAGIRTGCAAVGRLTLEHLPGWKGDTLMASIVLRMFQETPDEGVARRLARSVSELVATGGYTVIKATVNPYWKIPEYFEVVIEMNSAKSGEGIENALAKLGSGWLTQRRGEAIWNFGEGAQFVDGFVRWAHLEVLE